MTRSVARASLVLLALLIVACTPEPRARPSSSASATSSGTVASSPPLPSGSTPPRGDAPVARFAVIGDWGSGSPAQRAVASMMCNVRSVRPFDVVVTTGDNFYPDGRATRETYEDPMACLLAHPGHEWRASWGNHDIRSRERSTRSVLDAPHYYSFALGAADIFVVDSNVVSSDAQTTWLEERLRGSTASMRIVVFHHPPYSAGRHEPSRSVRRAWVPLFERYGVDLVLNGHNHGYEHHVKDGIDYVVSGGGGAGLYRCSREPETLRTCESAHHFLLVEVTLTRIDIEAIEPDGDVLDRVSIAA